MYPLSSLPKLEVHSWLCSCSERIPYFLSFLVIILDLESSALIKAPSTLSYVWGGFLLPWAINLFFYNIKKISELSTNLLVSSPPSIPPWSAPVPVSPAVGSCPFMPSFCPCPFLFNLVNARRDPFLLSRDCLVFVSVFGEGLCQKLFRN